MTDIIVFLVGLVILALPLIIMYGVKHEDPMKVFDALSEELDKTASSSADGDLIEVSEEGVKNESTCC